MVRFDLVHHIVYSFALAVAGAFLLGLWPGLILAAVLGLAKEIRDEMSVLSRFDMWDLAANGIGLAAAWIVMGGWM